MDQVKIIFFDIDGTLIDMSKKKISAKMIDTLQQLKERGLLLCIATGRSPIALPQFEGVSFDAFLTFNGSYCYNQTGTIYQNPIHHEDVSQIIENSSQLKRPAAIATNNQTVANGKDNDLVEYFAFAHQEVMVADDFAEIVKNGEIFQIMLGACKEEYPKVMAHTTGAKITAWWNRAVDIIPATSGKGTGIAKILDYYGLDKSQAIAFGDGNNDIEMLEAVGWGLAMANASVELKAVADETIGHVADDGIYQYCLEKGLIGKK